VPYLAVTDNSDDIPLPTALPIDVLISLINPFILLSPPLFFLVVLNFLKVVILPLVPKILEVIELTPSIPAF
jgi:hypothetical protein